MIITVIGSLGNNGINMQENIHIYMNMVDITARIHI